MFGANEAEAGKATDASRGHRGVMMVEGVARTRGASSGDMDGMVVSSLVRCSWTRRYSVR